MTATTPGTVTLHRVLRAPPERVYRAFLDPAAIPTAECYLGWQDSLQLLTLLVEPEIPAM